MKILVIGASGRVGGKLTEKLLHKNHKVVGTTRDDKKLFDYDNYDQISLDLTSDLDQIIADIPDDVEAIYFVSGSRGKNLLQVDLHGAVKTMQAAEKLDIKRYVMLSSVFAMDTEKWSEELPEDMYDYYIAKHYADSYLIHNTSLNYTILQPSTLKEEDGKGKIQINVDTAGENPIDDVAATLVEVLENKAAFKKIITMHSGDKDIDRAISEIK